MISPRLQVMVLALLGMSVSACGTLGGPATPAVGAPAGQAPAALDSAAAVDAALAGGLTRSQILLRSGSDFLLRGDLDKAQEVFNTGLKFDFNNPQLHFLNALTYHQRYLRGETDSLALAKTGYRTAALGDPALEGIAQLQLGRLFLDARDSASAKQSFALAVAANRQSTDALYGLAQAAALDGDYATAYWAASELEGLHWDDPRLLRLQAVLAALAQQPERARALVSGYAKSTGGGADAKYLQGRLGQLLTMKVALRAGAADAQPAGASKSAASPSAPPKPADAPAADAKPQQIPKWFRCDDAPAIPTRGGSGTTDENITTAPLPAPCPGETPRTAIIEVTTIQTEETKDDNLGINLLDGLSAIFTLQRARTFTKSTNVSEEVRTNNFVIANAAENSAEVLRYSLNIANAAYTKNEVIARPTLAAIDRVPAVFFSGATITLGVAGTAGGASTVVDKPVGVSLTVTPTFIDDDNMLVSMRATRSFIQSGLVPLDSSVLLQQSRNSISASAKLKFGETFVVSGLMAQQNSLSQSGVPVLQDVPVLQYLFKRSAKVDANLQILTMMTIRRPPDSAADAAKAGAGVAPHAMTATVSEFLKAQTAQPVIDSLVTQLGADRLPKARLRDKDLIDNSEGARAGLKGILDDFKQIIYF